MNKPLTPPIMQRNNIMVPVRPSVRTNPTTMPILSHVRELRSRLIKMSLAVVVGMVIGFWLVSDDRSGVMKYILGRFYPQGVQIVRVAEAFTSFIGVALLLGVILAMPVIIYQILRF